MGSLEAPLIQCLEYKFAGAAASLRMARVWLRVTMRHCHLTNVTSSYLPVDN